MRTIALLQLFLLPFAVLHDAAATHAQELKPSAACTPWSANYWGDVRITSQAEADEYACFRRIVGSLTLIQSSAKPIVMPKLHGVVGDLRIVFSSESPVRAERDPVRVLALLLPLLQNVTGHVALEYRGSSLLPAAAVSVVERVPPRNYR